MTPPGACREHARTGLDVPPTDSDAIRSAPSQQSRDCYPTPTALYCTRFPCSLDAGQAGATTLVPRGSARRRHSRTRADFRQRTSPVIRCVRNQQVHARRVWSAHSTVDGIGSGRLDRETRRRAVARR
jgi:hypothetical protein